MPPGNQQSGQIQRGTSSSSKTDRSTEVFTKTFDLLWTQAQQMLGEDAPQVICDAVHSDNPTQYVQDYTLNALSSAASQ